MKPVNCIALAFLLGFGCVDRNPYYEDNRQLIDGGLDRGPVGSKDGTIAGGDVQFTPDDGPRVPDVAVRDIGPMVADAKADAAAPPTDGNVSFDANRTDARVVEGDEDGDGFPAGQDCDDGDPDVFPGAQERCDGEDQDCDDLVDEAFALGQPCTAGLGACARTGRRRCSEDGTAQCDAVAGEPGQEECNGRDDDCDGTLDEGMENGCGGCGDGFVEQCNGRDDDCDDAIDEEWALGEVCFAGIGACRRGGVVVCDGAGGSGCSAQAAPESGETCNGLDDDCDGFIDEELGLGADCSAGEGACQREGSLQCTADGELACDAVAGPRENERCNALDDDCDGQADETFDLGEVCFVGVDNCRVEGRTACGDSELDVVCLTPGPMGMPERCNGLDDDCDERIDEGLLNACGECGQPPEEVCDGADNDCDGLWDEGVTNACGGCGNPPAEMCDGQDQDCDGQVDENIDVCVFGLGSLSADDQNDSLGFGAVLADAGDLTGDGVPDVFVASPDGGSGAVSLIDGQTARAVWTIFGNEGFGSDIAAFRVAPGASRTLAVGSPGDEANGTVYLYSGEGEEQGQFGGDGDFHVGKVLLGTDGSPRLVMGDPDQGILDNGAIRLLDVQNPGDALTFDGEFSERLGERLFDCPDLDRDASNEILTTVRFNFLRDRGAVIYGSANLGDRTDRIQTASQTSEFGQGFTAGDFAGDGRTVLVFGDPRSDRSRGEIHLFVDGGFIPRSLGSGQRNDGQGHALATLPRAGEPDILVVGSNSSQAVELWRLERRGDGEFAIDRSVSVTRAGVSESFGRALVISEPGVDGTRRLFIGEPDAQRGEGAIHVFSIR